MKPVRTFTLSEWLPVTLYVVLAVVLLILYVAAVWFPPARWETNMPKDASSIPSGNLQGSTTNPTTRPSNIGTGDSPSE